MNIFAYTISIIISFIAAFSLCKYAFNQPLEIKFKCSKTDWVFPVSIALISFLLAFSVEWLIGLLVVHGVNPERNMWCMIVVKLFENGVLIPVICLLISYIFEKMIEYLNLDYMTLYSATVSRICFSVIIICVCIKMFIVAISSQDDNGDLDFMLNRIIMWFLTVIGTWVGIGFKCEGRIEKEKKKKKMRKHVSKEEYMGFWIPIIVCLIFLAFLVFKVDVLQSNPIFMNSILLAALFFMVFVFVLLQAYLAKYKPSEKQSKKILENAFKTRPRTKQHFGRMVYFVKDNTIYIYKDKKIVYPGHEKDAEFIRLFGKKKIPMHDYNSVESEFVKRYNEQKEYIDCEIKKCISDRKDSLVDNAYHYDLNKI